MSFNISDVKEIREMTGAGMMDCKKALVEADGAKDKAIDWLRQKGLSKAAKKAGRVAAEGSVSSFVSADGKTGVLLEVNCETDFVAKNDDFKNFASAIAEHVATNGETTATWTSGDTVLDQKFSGDTSITVKDFLTTAVAKIGENIVIRRFARFDLSNAGAVSAYIHGEGRIGVLLETTCDKADVASSDEYKTMLTDISMHIAAMAPEFVSMDNITEEAKEKEIAVLKAKAIEEGKKPEFLDKILVGQIKKWAAGICLHEQAFVKNPDLTVKEFAEQTASKLGGKVTITKFTRFELGEGIEKKADNFAEEVAQMTN
ncbi:MAG: translation elongation factor Ts [Bdellovibrionales bacterium]